LELITVSLLTSSFVQTDFGCKHHCFDIELFSKLQYSITLDIKEFNFDDLSVFEGNPHLELDLLTNWQDFDLTPTAKLLV